MLRKMKRGTSSDDNRSISKPSLSPNIRESQIISKAMDLAEKRIEEGTASPSEIIHFLKLGSSLANLEREKLEKENKLLEAKANSLESMKNIEELYKDAMNQMKIYRGESDD